MFRAADGRTLLYGAEASEAGPAFFRYVPTAPPAARFSLPEVPAGSGCSWGPTFFGQVDRGEGPPAPHGSGRARLRHPALQRAGFAAFRSIECTAIGGGSGRRFRILFIQSHVLMALCERRPSHFFQRWYTSDAKLERALEFPVIPQYPLLPGCKNPCRISMLLIVTLEAVKSQLAYFAGYACSSREEWVT